MEINIFQFGICCQCLWYPSAVEWVSRIWICFGFGKIATIRRRGAHIANVVPGPRPRTGFWGRDVKHCLLLWWYAVGKDQATKLHVWHLIFHCRCIGNGKRRRLVCPLSCQNWSFLPFKVFVQWIRIFSICLNYWKLLAIMITTWGRSSWRWIKLLYFVVLLRCISQLQTVSIPRHWFWFGILGHLLVWHHFGVILLTMLNARLMFATSPKSTRWLVLAQRCTNSLTTMVIMFTCHVCLTIFQQWMFGCSLPRYTINFMVVILWWTAMKWWWSFAKRDLRSQFPLTGMS